MEHKFEYACQTPRGGLAGGDDCYICVHCGMMTTEPTDYEKHKYENICKGAPTTDSNKHDLALWKSRNSSLCENPTRKQP